MVRNISLPCKAVDCAPWDTFKHNVLEPWWNVHEIDQLMFEWRIAGLRCIKKYIIKVAFLTTGVPQDSILCPMLLLIYGSDLPLAFNSKCIESIHSRVLICPLMKNSSRYARNLFWEAINQESSFVSTWFGFGYSQSWPNEHSTPLSNATELPTELGRAFKTIRSCASNNNQVQEQRKRKDQES